MQMIVTQSVKNGTMLNTLTPTGQGLGNSADLHPIPVKGEALEQVGKGETKRQGPCSFVCEPRTAALTPAPPALMNVI